MVPKTYSPTNMSLVMSTVPIRFDSVPHGTVFNPIRLDMILYGTVPDVIDLANIFHPSTVQSSTNSITTHVPPNIVSLAFVQGLTSSKRNGSHFRNKY